MILPPFSSFFLTALTRYNVFIEKLLMNSTTLFCLWYVVSNSETINHFMSYMCTILHSQQQLHLIFFWGSSGNGGGQIKNFGDSCPTTIFCYCRRHKVVSKFVSGYILKWSCWQSLTLHMQIVIWSTMKKKRGWSLIVACYSHTIVKEWRLYYFKRGPTCRIWINTYLVCTSSMSESQRYGRLLHSTPPSQQYHISMLFIIACAPYVMTSPPLPMKRKANSKIKNACFIWGCFFVGV